MQLVIPMAGLGQRFKNAGYTTLKPLLPIKDKLMISVVLNNLSDPRITKLVLVASREVGEGLKGQKFVPKSLAHADIVFLELESLSEGPAKTVEAALGALDPLAPVVVANSDQFFLGDFSQFLDRVENAGAGCIMTMIDTDPKWSFVRLNSKGLVSLVKEKEAISSIATVGVYGFRSANVLRRALEQMFDQDDRTNGEFYVAPAYNQIIKAGGQVEAFSVGSCSESFFGLGVPDDYEFFLKSAVSVASTGFVNT
jgi:dTDP-glucose pyrophosphorylase